MLWFLPPTRRKRQPPGSEWLLERSVSDPAKDSTGHPLCSIADIMDGVPLNRSSIGLAQDWILRSNLTSPRFGRLVWMELGFVFLVCPDEGSDSFAR